MILKMFPEVSGNLKQNTSSADSVFKDFHCTNGQDPHKLSKVDALRLFAEGPCVPAILVPGVMATKLAIEIDCEIFSKNEPKAFAKCGWNACQANSYEFWKKIPKKEYQLWIPDLTSELSIMSIYSAFFLFHYR